MNQGGTMRGLLLSTIAALAIMAVPASSAQAEGTLGFRNCYFGQMTPCVCPYGQEAPVGSWYRESVANTYLCQTVDIERVRAVPSGTGVAVEWTPAPWNLRGLGGFLIYLREGIGPRVGMYPASSDMRSYTITDQQAPSWEPLHAGTQYEVTVCTTVAYGYENGCNETTVTIPAAPKAPLLRHAASHVRR
jgi:hypothetical protein